MFSKVLLLFIGTIYVISAEVVNIQPCARDFPGQVDNCTLNEVRITPCREAQSGRVCKIKVKRGASIDFDFTPGFSSETLTNEVFWLSPTGNLPFINIDNNACLYTSCPLVADQMQSYSYALNDKKFPIGSYDVQWSISGENNNKCCFVVQIRLT